MPSKMRPNVSYQDVRGDTRSRTGEGSGECTKHARAGSSASQPSPEFRRNSCLFLSAQAAEGPMIRLAIAEDHTIVRWALREALSKADDIEVVGEAGTATETLDMIRRERPDVLILDISLPDR